MNFKSAFRIAGIAGALFIFGGAVNAQGPGPSTTGATSSELAMSALVENSVQLNITANGGLAVTGTDASGLYAVDFGNVNALGTGTAAAGVTVLVSANGALYSTPVTLTPVYTGFTTETATIEVTQDAAGDQIAREGNGVITEASIVDNVIPTPVAAGIASNAPVNRSVGVFIALAETTGVKTATLIYTVTME